jgi:hypothetical protein
MLYGPPEGNDCLQEVKEEEKEEKKKAEEVR